METPVQPIPFCVPNRSPDEERYVSEALGAGAQSGHGGFSTRSRALLTGATGGGPVFLTTSGTAALELATMVLGVGPGDEIIVPSFTFSSVANAVVLRGATPVFVDVEPNWFNIDPNAIELAITERTKAIIVVHYAGVICDMERITAIARRHGVRIIEDAAHAIGSSRSGRPAGSFGDMAAFSFHYTKNISCGEGGCLVVNDPALLQRVEIAFEKGTNRAAFMKGFVDKYSWVDVGASFTLGEVNAAVLTSQLEALDSVTAHRQELWNIYFRRCSELASDGAFSVPRATAEGNHNAHLFHLLLPTEDDQLNFIAAMRSRQIATPFHYVPLHSSPAGQRFGRTAGAMTVTNAIWSRLVRLPLFPALGDAIDRVTEAVASWSADR